MDEVLYQFQEAAAVVFANKLVATSFLWFQNIMIAISALLALGIVYIGIRINRGLRQSTGEFLSSITIEPSEVAAPKGIFQKRWDGFEERLKSDRESDWKLVLIEADKLLEDEFRAAGFEGDGLGNMLRRLDQSKLANLDAAWRAHRVRNDIVHNPQSELTAFEAKVALENFGAALRELEVID